MGQLVVIAGVTGGIGSALCKEVSKKIENEIIGVYRNQNKFEKLSLELNSKRVHGCLYGELEDALSELLCINTYERLVFVACMFSISPIKRIDHLEDKGIVNNINTNIIGNITLFNCVLRLSKKHNCRLDIINLDSGAAYRPIEGWSLYSASKAYINMYLKSVVYENKSVRAVSFDPGVVDTDMQKEIRCASKDEFADVEIFCRYKEDNFLNLPEMVAECIYERYIKMWSAEAFEERIGK